MVLKVIIIVVGFVCLSITIIAVNYISYIKDKDENSSLVARAELEAKTTLGQMALTHEVIKSKIADVRIDHSRYNPYKSYGDDAQKQLYTVFYDGFEKGREAMREEAMKIVQRIEMR